MTGYSPADLARRADASPPDAETVAAEVARVLGALDRLSDTPTVEHVAIFEDVQASLADTLSTVDDA